MLVVWSLYSLRLLSNREGVFYWKNVDTCRFNGRLQNTYMSLRSFHKIFLKKFLKL